MQGQAPPSLGKRAVGTQQRWGKHEKRERRAHSGRDEGGSAANQVRRLLSLFAKCLRKWLVVFCYVTIFFSFFGRINHLVLHHLHWSSVNMQADIMSGTIYSAPSGQTKYRRIRKRSKPDWSQTCHCQEKWILSRQEKWREEKRKGFEKRAVAIVCE